MNVYRAVRRGTIFKALAGTEPFHWVRPRASVVEMGTKYGRWGIDAAGLSASTTLVTFGLGQDVSFELALIERYGCTVHGFDPTPASVRYLAEHVREPRLRTHAYAIADHDGSLSFAPPPSQAADHVSASAYARYDEGRPEGYSVPCLTLASARRVAGLGAIDVLKMDVEGAEYAVIAQALAEGWLDGVSQLMVEFHHFLPGLAAADTRRTIASLQQAGFGIGWIGRTNHEYLFVRRGPVDR